MNFFSKLIYRTRDLTVLLTPPPLLFPYWRGKRAFVGVYQMGKVASSSIYWTLCRYPDLAVFHFHRTLTQNFRQVRSAVSTLPGAWVLPPWHEWVGFAAGRLIRSRRLPIRLVTIVREPIGRNLSAYFQNLKIFLDSRGGLNQAHLQQLVDTFIDKYTHDIPLNWFDDEFLPATGVDVYREPFEQARGWMILRQDGCEVLVLRHDLADPVKSEALAAFLSIPPPKMLRANEAEAKPYSALYQEVVQRMTLPEDYVSRMLTSRYARHFFPLQERRQLAERWCGATSTVLQSIR